MKYNATKTQKTRHFLYTLLAAVLSFGVWGGVTYYAIFITGVAPWFIPIGIVLMVGCVWGFIKAYEYIDKVYGS